MSRLNSKDGSLALHDAGRTDRDAAASTERTGRSPATCSQCGLRGDPELELFVEPTIEETMSLALDRIYGLKKQKPKTSQKTQGQSFLIGVKTVRDVRTGLPFCSQACLAQWREDDRNRVKPSRTLAVLRVLWEQAETWQERALIEREAARVKALAARGVFHSQASGLVQEDAEAQRRTRENYLYHDEYRPWGTRWTGRPQTIENSRMTAEERAHARLPVEYMSSWREDAQEHPKRSLAQQLVNCLPGRARR